ncbi:hypothetical protein ACYE2N_01640 [Flavobacterium sp. MAHUQ-51]|uniref:hypothetical protein n=1 Tax=Flavobacterium sp. GCM10022190 TaxID=3252639 RepID=UPI0036187689
MNTEDICKYLKQQESNLDYYKKKVEILENQIEARDNINFIRNDIEVELKKENYTKEEIVLAYNRMAEYEGVKHRFGKTITDTFIEFLNETHHSLK